MAKNFDKDTEYFLKKIEPIIKNHLVQTDVNERDDLSQDIKFKVLDKIQLIKQEEAPDFFNYVKMRINDED
ncbi:hypothetical protein [Bacillus sp. Brlt_9]|uniref:hypothetical protein n=1 Tax=Bacillus sp. Brlt_9 TaxID=3110916 RepID=UPI003F7B56A0